MTPIKVRAADLTVTKPEPEPTVSVNVPDVATRNGAAST